MPFKFFAEGGATGQLLTAVDRHRTRAANRRSTGIAKRQTPVAFVLDANQRIEHCHPASDVEPDFLRMRCGIDFGIESLDRKGQTHGQYRHITNLLSHSRENFARGHDKSRRQLEREFEFEFDSPPISISSSRYPLLASRDLSSRHHFLGYPPASWFHACSCSRSITDTPRRKNPSANLLLPLSLRHSLLACP
jgi:hypothetical protein